MAVRYVRLVGARTKEEANKTSGRVINGEVEEYLMFSPGDELAVELMNFTTVSDGDDGVLKWEMALHSTKWAEYQDTGLHRKCIATFTEIREQANSIKAVSITD